MQSTARVRKAQQGSHVLLGLLAACVGLVFVVPLAKLLELHSVWGERAHDGTVILYSVVLAAAFLSAVVAEFSARLAQWSLRLLLLAALVPAGLAYLSLLCLAAYLDTQIEPTTGIWLNPWSATLSARGRWLVSAVFVANLLWLVGRAWSLRKGARGDA